MTPSGPDSSDPRTLDLSATLVGVDGLEVEPQGPPRPDSGRRLRLDADAAARIRAEVERAGGREVCFLADVRADGTVADPRAVARGNRAAVLAVARDVAEGALMIHNHPSGRLEPSDADLEVAARVWEEGLGTAITDNAASELYVVVEPPAPRERHPLDLDELAALIGPGGPLAARFAGWEDRPGQREMLRLVGERYNEDGVALVEAGTGTGKSLAYLIPAAAWALRNEERTVISTATINLQEQLVGKDLPLVGDLVGGDRFGNGAVGTELTWALVKGRGNYVSIRRAGLALASSAELFPDDRTKELEAIRDWLATTDDGSLADLPAPPSDEVWEEVRSDPDACLRARCPHFQQCFFQRSRRRAASARILVVNHHMLFTDIAVRSATGNWTQSAVLPPYAHVVLDEAHNVEDAATENLGASVTQAGLRRVLSRLDRRGRGVLNAVAEELAGSETGRGSGHESDATVELRTRIEERIRPTVDEVRSRAKLFFEAIEPLVPGGPAESDAARIGAGEGTVPEPDDRIEVRERLDGLLGGLQRLAKELVDLRRAIENDETLFDGLEGRLLDLRSAERRLLAAEASLRLVLRPGERALSLVRWIETRGRGRRRSIVLAAAPVELGPTLRESLFSKMRSVALTSASLSTRGDFAFLKGRFGLEADALAEMERPVELVERIVPSPFDFRRQSLLVVPTDLPDAARGDADFQHATAEVIADLVRRTDGGVFGLFTSYRALRDVAERLRSLGLDREWPLFVHGERPRTALLADFIASGRGVLLGTSSFWEGVDVPGEPLRGLVIQKIPFRVPTEPVTAARVEAMERRGVNAFYGYVLPLAALRLKQGFGRLVRSRDDRGAVLLLDDRIVRKRYGRVLRDSLPDVTLTKGPWAEMSGIIRSFYDAPAEGP